MHRVIILLMILAVMAGGCAASRSGSEGPGGMTGTSGTTTGTGTAAPTGTIGTGSTDPASTGAVIPKEGESSLDPDDSAITSTVVARLTEAGLGQSIEVETDDGIVTLKGTAPSQAEIERIIKLVQGLPDVQSVTSELTVK